MAEDILANRPELERKLQRILTRLLSLYGGNILEALGDPPNLSNIPPSFWDDESKRWVEAMRPLLENTYLEAAAGVMSTTSVGIDWALANAAAAEWAAGYAFDLVRGINNTTRDALQRTISAYFQAPTTRGELESRILQLVASPVRAEMIAVTEVTRAATEGERAIARELAAQGIDLKPIWNTNRDDLVCPLCGPRDGHEITDGEYPPRHPRCRCWVSHEIRQ